MRLILFLLFALCAVDCQAQYKVFDFSPPKQIKEIVQPPSRIVWADQRIYGRWTWPGYPSTAALRRHLAQPPHNLNVNHLNNRQVVELHNKEHDRIGPVPARPQRRAAVYCPT